MAKEFGLLIFIGRFQPYHNGHHHVIKQAIEKADRVLILVGSSFRKPDARNPYTFEQRADMIYSSFPRGSYLYIEPLSDFPYEEEKWIEEVQHQASRYEDKNKKTGLIGHSKDHSSYYLKLFPTYESVDVKGVEEEGNLLDATNIRKLFYSRKPYETLVPEGTVKVLSKIPKKDFDNICDELMFIDEYKKTWGTGPFVTVDAVVVQAGHVLLVERGDFPGKGQLALPGGFVEPREQLENAVMRELREETSIDVPPAVLKSRITHMQHFSYPWRSNRAHIITFAFLFDLNNEIDKKAGTSSAPLGMTRVKGGDDAADAFWYPIGKLSREMMFEDHYDIIDLMLNKKSIGKL